MGIFRQFPYSNFHDMNMDELIKIVRQLADDWLAYQVRWEHLYEDVESAFEAFQTDFNAFIASCNAQYQAFINSINVEAEFREALDSMVADGSFNRIISPTVATQTTAWLDEHITQPTTPVVDTSLAVAGAAADSKTVGTRFRSDEQVARQHRYMHQYNYQQYDYINGYYDANGNIVSSATIRSYIVPIRSHDQVFYVNSNTSVAILGAGKTFIALAPKEQVSSPVLGSSVTVTCYKFDFSGYPDAVYAAVPYSSGAIFVRSASYHMFIPMFPINADGTCNDYEVVVDNTEITYPDTHGKLGSLYSEQVINMSNGAWQHWDGRYSTDLIVIKKGTTVSCKYSNMAFVVRGMTAGNLFTISGTQEVTFGADFIGTLDYNLAGWLHPGYAPVGMTPIEEGETFIKMITQEDKDTNPWYGKTWYCFGTSLSDIGVNDSAGNNGVAGKYPLYVDQLSGLQRVNRAIGSGGIRTNAPHGGNVLQNILATPYNVDLVTLEVLPNDGYENPANVGNITDTGTTTICGAFKTACNYIEQNTRARMMLLFIGGQIGGDPMNSNHTAYCAAKEKLKAIAEMYGVIVIDAEAEAIDWYHKKINLTYIDNIHMNYLGGEITGVYVWDRIKEHKPYPEFAQ